LATRGQAAAPCAAAALARARYTNSLICGGLDGLPSGSGTETEPPHAVSGSGRSLRQNQDDSLRSLSMRISQLGKDLRRQKRRIAAIGVLGSGVRDKLLALRALRRQFPQAFFFTTDYDRALVASNELGSARNLIVASSFGPVLHRSIQRETPAFQSSYQTSAFLATLLAIGDPAKAWSMPPEIPARLSEQLLAPRIFEIERNGDIRTFPGDRLPILTAYPQDDVCKQRLCPENSGNCNSAQQIAGAAHIMEGRSSAQSEAFKSAIFDCKKSGDPTNCGDIQPASNELFPQFEKRSQILAGIGLACSAILILVLLHLGILPPSVCIEARLVSLVLAAAALACAFWVPLGQLLTESGNGEPVRLLQGVSV
jgi:hypothetical protein